MQYKVIKPAIKPLPLDTLLKRVHLTGDCEPEDVEDFCALCDEASRVAAPVALWAVAPIDERGGDTIVSGGVRFHSSLLANNLQHCDVFIPYVISCGVELGEWSKRYASDFLKQYWADIIMIEYLHQARQALDQVMARDVFGGGTYASMNPGSLKEWPIQEQQPLFELLGGVEPLIGVSLTPEYLMVPAKTGSGIFFTDEKGFVNCRLCPRSDCPNRRAAYDSTTA